MPQRSTLNDFLQLFIGLLPITNLIFVNFLLHISTGREIFRLQQPDFKLSSTFLFVVGRIVWRYLGCSAYCSKDERADTVVCM